MFSERDGSAETIFFYVSILVNSLIVLFLYIRSSLTEKPRFSQKAFPVLLRAKTTSAAAVW
ncbi:hypothetical protein BED41_00225 [Cloacibacillus porcorum]|uniref:Uncharacterized protein n=1 Tax=Cloacibacillus porcorum TaxID=1197717 RepID=A0A1B2I126_9BACT|nr:hypothetical protein BED41_00225 [Cloacibacillus porcorum]